MDGSAARFTCKPDKDRPGNFHEPDRAAESSEISKGRNHAAEAADGRANERASQREVAADAVIYV